MPASERPPFRDHGPRRLAHTAPETAQLIAATGTPLLFFPPYSPDLNPIEQGFAALKKRREYQDQATLDDIVRRYH
ncbi:MAG: transposase [Nitrospira sp.]|nr:transposase [Nitrospira sp.]